MQEWGHVRGIPPLAALKALRFGWEGCLATGFPGFVEEGCWPCRVGSDLLNDWVAGT